MAGHLLFNSGSNESSLAPQFKWLDNTFNIEEKRLITEEEAMFLRLQLNHALAHNASHPDNTDLFYILTWGCHFKRSGGEGGS